MPQLSSRGRHTSSTKDPARSLMSFCSFDNSKSMTDPHRMNGPPAYARLTSPVMASTTIVVDRIGQASDPVDDLADRALASGLSARQPRQPLDGRSIVCPILYPGEFLQMADREGLPGTRHPDFLEQRKCHGGQAPGFVG